MDADDPIPGSEVNQTCNEVSEFQFQNIPHSPLMEAIEEAEITRSLVSLTKIVNSPAPRNADPSPEQISDRPLPDLFNLFYRNSENLTNDFAVLSTYGFSSINSE